MFGRDAGRERSDDHVTRASDAMDRGHGIDGNGQREQRIEREAGERRGGKSRERSAGRERAGQESGRAERELDRGPGDAGGSGREPEHEKAVEPKTPDVDLGAKLPLPASGQTMPAIPRNLPQPTLRPPGGAGRPGGP